MPLDVTIAVAGPGTGAPAATGSMTLTGGGYTTSSATALSNSRTTVTIPAGALAAGSDTLTATYTPDTAGATLFNSAPGSSSPVTVVIFSTVTVNQATSLAPVTDQLMGMNLASWYDVVGNATSINPAFARAGIKAIRWPGGSWSDAYHWNAGGLPFLCNMNTTGVTAWAGYSTFSQFVTAIPQAGRYDLALTANYGSNSNCTAGGDPTEAAAWAAEALTLGNPPSHITVGNENYGSWEYDLHARKNDPTTYANAVIGSHGYYQLITAASPATRVGVVVNANCTSADGCTDGWDSTVLTLAKGSYDFVEYHYYPQFGDITSDTYLVHQAALDFTTNINTIKSELASVGMSGTPIYAGEIGANAGDPGTQGWSITQGLYAGQLLGEAMNDGISRLTWWIGFGNCLGSGNNSPLLYGWQNSWGAYNVFSDADPSCPGEGPIGTMNPTAQAFNLFQNIAVNGESALGTTFSGDSNNIRVYAATHSGGTALFLFNLNQNLSQPVQIKLSKTSGPVSSVHVITYDKSIYDKTNSTPPVWAPPTTTNLASPALPLTLSLTPWSMNVVLIQ